MVKVKRFCKEYFIGLVLIAMIVVFGLARPDAFLTTGNLFTILRQVSITGIMAMGLLFVMLSGGIDLSIGSTVSLSSVMSALLMVKAGLNPVAAIILTLLITMAVGFLIGTVIVKTRIWPMIGTIAMQTILSGTAFLITGGLPVSGLPSGVRVLAQGYVGPIPVPVLLFIAVAAVTGIILNYTYVGRYFYLVGSNPEAARLSGINKDRVQIMSYGICGLLSGFAGAVMLGRIGSGMANAGTGLEMECLTALVIGGISLAGGEGKITKAIIGILFMGILVNGMTILNISEYSQQVIKGAVFLLAVCLDGITRIMAGKAKARS